MKGNIYTDQKCPECNSSLKYDANRGNCFCKNHPHIAATSRYRVIFDKIHLRFQDIREAEQALYGLRFKSGENTLDARDYKRDNPLSFKKLAEKWILQKSREKLAKTTFANLRKEITRAVECFGDQNIKYITSAELEDFIYADHRKEKSDEPISDKTRANLKSCLHQFFKWASRRERFEMPEFPDVRFELGWRKIVTLSEQQAILDEIRRISWDRSPRIWLGIHILSHNVNIRPGELLTVKQGDILLEYGFINVKHAKEGSLKAGKQAHLWPEEIEVIQQLMAQEPHTLPHVYFFRHTNAPGIKAGTRFSAVYWNKWAMKACENLKLPRIGLYALVKHSTMTAALLRFE